MKTRFALILALAGGLLLAGCNQVAPVAGPPEPQQPGAIAAPAPTPPYSEAEDPIVVNAEKVTRLALQTFDTFLKIERQNQAALEQISGGYSHVFAETLRRNAKKWILDARALTKAYKHNRSAENKANLQTALAVLSTSIEQSRKYIAQASTQP